MNQSRLSGPIEEGKWTDKLLARTVTPGSSPRLHGYDVESDLAAHYSFFELTVLALKGDLPTEQEAAALEQVAMFLAPISTATAPVHAGMLTRLCGGTSSASFGAGALMLGEQARFTVENASAWLAALADGATTASSIRPADDDERATVARLTSAIARAGLEVSALASDLSLTAAAMAVLFACGLRTPEQMQAFFLVARLPATLAEILATVPAQFRTYPIALPRFDYQLEPA